MPRYEHTPTISQPPESPSPVAPPGSLLHLSFNQNHTCFAAGTDHGYRIYSCDPFGQILVRDLGRRGGVGIVEMLFRSQVWAFVGGGPDPRYLPNKVIIWNNLQSRCTAELSFRSPVRAVRLRPDRIVVVLEHKVKIHNFDDLKLTHEIETISNPRGLCQVSHDQVGSMVLVCPGLRKGQVRIEHYSPSKRAMFVMTHDSSVACLALTPDGKFLATASAKGTLIRVFSTLDGRLFQEVRRGADKADIYSLVFSPNTQWLAVSSDKGTAHVFRLKVTSGSLQTLSSASETNAAVALSASSLSFIRGILPKYFSSEWSVAKFHLLEGSKYIVAFGQQKNTVVILGMDGSFYRCRFDPVIGGEMTQLEYRNIFHDQISFSTK